MSIRTGMFNPDEAKDANGVLVELPYPTDDTRLLTKAAQEGVERLYRKPTRFKPNVATYTKAAEIMGVQMDEVLFVANRAFDCLGAKVVGMRSALIDRRNHPFGGTPHQPDIWVKDMQSLADHIV